MQNNKGKIFDGSKLFKNKKNLMKVAVILLIILIAIAIRISKYHKEQIKVKVNKPKVITEETKMYIDISGEVINPGVYKVSSRTRLFEIIEKAGGLTKNADKDQINQADFVKDGQKIIIPAKNKDGGNNNNSNISISDSNSSNGLVNINLASKEELKEITGVGDVIADRIIEYRESTPFKSKEDLMNVKGIGNATFEKMKDEVTI